ASFAALFARRGRPAEAPWRLALVTVMQFAAGLSERQAAEAVRARIDWKYALGLELTDPGFDFSVLSAFPARLVAGAAEHLLLERLLAVCREHGWLRARGRQRTDATRVRGALRVLHRLERVAETRRAALNALAAAAPDWLRSIAPPEWHERYDRRIADYRLPRGREARLAYAATVGADGERLLEALTAPNAPEPLAPLPAVAVLRRVWKAEFTVVAGQLQLRGPKALPAAADQIEPPYEPAARSATKRELHWVGYVDIVGPIPADQQWQAKAQTGFEVSRFVVDGEAPVVTCPRDRLQYVATAAAMNMGRLVDWLDEIPRAQTRRSRFAALDPAA